MMPCQRLELEAAPEQLFAALRRGPFNVWLDSAAADHQPQDHVPGDGVPLRYRYGRYSYLYLQPSAIFSWQGSAGRLLWLRSGGLLEALTSPGASAPRTGPLLRRMLTALQHANMTSGVPETTTLIDQQHRRHRADFVTLKGSPLEVLRTLLTVAGTAGPGAEPAPHLPPVQGGAAGYLGYDLGRHLERLPEQTGDELGLPEIWLGLYPIAYIFDHGAKTWYGAVAPGALSGTAIDDESTAARDARGILQAAGDYARSALAAAGTPAAVSALGGFRASELRANFDRGEYEAAVQRIRDYIAAGDVFQVNLSQRFAAPFTGNPLALYRRLRRVSPEPYAAYLETPQVAVCCASPELFLEVRGRHVVTRPIKGTRPRNDDPAEDERLAVELSASEKDRAELIMITDLERNDLGRVCETGSVQVPRLVSLEAHPQVFHLVSTVTGRLKADAQLPDLISAAFPGGSITGAPKIRAMEIIEELEPVRRGLYTGAIGHFGFNGAADFNIVIRTMWITGGKVYLQVGGGVIADSDPVAEYEETLHKARGMFHALAGESPG